MRTRLHSTLSTLLGVVLAATSLYANGNSSKRLETDLPGTKLQPITALDKTGLRLMLNEQADGVVLEGWSTKALTAAESEALFKQFGVRVDPSGDPKNGYLVAPSNVGRAGILDGDIYMKLDGKIYKGMTLKGYGGNTVHGKREQPDGSMDIKEGFRDMEVSTILLEGKISTYVGVLIVERPNGQANYVRLSRTALRMEDLTRVQGKDLEKVVDYLTDLLKDEMGKKLSVAEFDSWLVKETADILARKEHIRFAHGSVTKSNIGIGELVDLGDTSGGLRLPNEALKDTAYKTSFKEILEETHKNIASIDASANTLDFEKTYTESFETRMQELRAFDSARINLNEASAADLTQLGFTQTEADLIVKYNAQTPDGILDPQEIKSLQGMARDLEALLDQTTTSFLKLTDGTRLGQYYIRNLGGSEGVRELLKETRDYMTKNNITVTRDAKGLPVSSSPQLAAEIERLALERAEKLGFVRVGEASSVTNFARFVSHQILEVLARR